MEDVALHAGVSQGLVSRVLNQDPTLSIRESTRESILRAVDELGYVPNSVAASLRRSRTNTLGLALDDLTNPQFREIVQGAQSTASAYQCLLLLINVSELAKSPDMFEQFIKSGRIDGLLIQGGYGYDDISSRYGGLIPTVVVNSPGEESMSSVVLDDARAAEIATDHLVSLGHRRIQFIGGAPGRATDRRFEGFQTAARRAGIDVSLDEPVTSGWQTQDGFDVVYNGDADIDSATGIVVASDITAIGVLRALADRGTAVPEDVSVVAIHDAWIAKFLTPPLTTVALPMRALGEKSVAVLMDQIDGAAPTHMIIKEPQPTLLLRSSTAPPRSSRAGEEHGDA